MQYGFPYGDVAASGAGIALGLTDISAFAHSLFQLFCTANLFILFSNYSLFICLFKRENVRPNSNSHSDMRPSVLLQSQQVLSQIQHAAAAARL